MADTCGGRLKPESTVWLVTTGNPYFRHDPTLFKPESGKIMFKFFFAIAFSLFATISTAATETEIIRALLDDGNVSGLEENFLRLHNSALKENDFTEVRDVIFKSMATTHDVRIETINAWITANPQSPYAMVAAAQMHLHIAF